MRECSNLLLINVTLLAELTFMVNNSVIIRLQEPQMCSLEQQKDRTIITNGPVYCLESVQENLHIDRIFVINDKASDDMLSEFTPSLQDEEFIPYIKALTHEDRESSERCLTSQSTLVDCDGYAMKWNRFSRKRWQDAPFIYLKFGFSVDNPTLLIISIHPSKRKNVKKR